MRTEQLISVLASDGIRPRSIEPRVMGTSGLLLLVVACAALLILGVRSDLLPAMATPVSAMKWLLPLGVAVPALIAALALLRPVTQRTPMLVIAVAIAFGAGIWLLISVAGTPTSQLWPEIRGSSNLECLVSITAISLLPLAVAIRIMRDGASPAPGHCGACIGMAVGGFSTAIYAAHCDEDAPLFFLVWYSLAIMIVTLIGMLAGRKLLRW